MFIFIRLLLAHFIGDFPLQSNRIYVLKHRGLRGGIPHALLIVLSLIILSWPYLKLPALWSFILFMGIIHLVQDGIKISYEKIKYAFWLYLFDQFFHVATVAAVFLTGLRNLTAPQSNNNPIVLIYNNDVLILYLIAAILVTYNGFYLIRTFKATFLGTVDDARHPFGKFYGMFERLGLLTILLLGGYYLLLIPVLFFLRPLIIILHKNRLKSHQIFVSRMEILLSWIIALIVGCALHIVTRRI